MPILPLHPLQVSAIDAVNETVADVIAYLPTVLGALVVLVVGYILGRFLGGLVARVLRRLGIDRYAEGTAMQRGEGGDPIARAVGKLVSYYVYFVTLVAAADILDIELLTTLLADLAAFLPVILGALAVLVVGFVVGRIVGDIVADLVGGFGVGRFLRETPLEQFGDTEGEFGRVVGKLVTYYVYLLTLLAVADILAIDALSTLLNTFAAYLPALVGGLLVLLVGIWVAERVGALIDESGDDRATEAAALLVKVFIYYLAVTIALAAIGFDVVPLTNLFTTVVVAFFGALAVAVAIGIGVAVGLGGQDYVAENVDGWVEAVRGETSEEGSTRD